MIKNIIHEQHNHIGKRGKWAQLYTKKIIQQLESIIELSKKQKIEIERRVILPLLNEAASTLPPECIKDDVVFYSKRFDEYAHIEKEIFENIVEELEESKRGYYNPADDYIVVHRPNAERTAREIIEEMIPGKSGHFYNDIIFKCFRYQDENGRINKFDKRAVSRKKITNSE